MVFSTLTFMSLALPMALAAYFALPRRFRNAWLLLFSLFFYAWGEPAYVFLMIFSTAMNWGFARLIEDRPKYKRVFLTLTIISDIGMLAVFKYSALLAETLNALPGLNVPVPRIPLPIGISFFTFQSMSYVIDVYRGRVKAQRRIDRMGLYICLFPQMVAGPIVRYADIAEQIESRKETLEGFTAGMQRFIVGLSKKVLLANALAPLADEVFSRAGSFGPMGAWLGLFAYTFQIYFDFSGYSDMAIGIGRMFGFQFKENFDYPYISRSVKEFWNRWHMSLGTWFRDYLYIPLGGNRVKKPRRILNIGIVFLLTGLWHGASWTFVIWGAYHGVFRILEECFERRGPRLIQWAGTMLVVLFGWVLFRADSLPDAWRFICGMFGAGGALWPIKAAPRAFYALAIGALTCLPMPSAFLDRFKGAYTELIRWPALVALLILCMASLASGTYNPFIYTRF